MDEFGPRKCVRTFIDSLIKFKAIQSNTANINKSPEKRNLDTSTFRKWRFWREVKYTRNRIRNLKCTLSVHWVYAVYLALTKIDRDYDGLSNMFHSGQSIKVNVQRPDLIVLKCPGMTDWVIHSNASLQALTLRKVIMLSNNIWIRDNGYYIWTRDSIREVIDSVCKLFSVWLWYQARFSQNQWLWSRLLRSTDKFHISNSTVHGKHKTIKKRNTIGERLWPHL